MGEIEDNDEGEKGMKILINTPSLKLVAGVANHYLGLRNYWTEPVMYNYVGKRNTKSGSGKYWLPWDVLKFVFRLLTFRPDVVVLNPSLGRSALIRDFAFLSIAKIMNRKVIIFMHGFDLNYAKVVDRNWVVDYLNRAEAVFVLADFIKATLIEWGVKVPICLTTTKVDDALVKGYDVRRKTGKVENILFLTRIEKYKGVYESLEVFSILKAKYPHLKLTIVGGGTQVGSVKDAVLKNNVKDVVFTGALSGKKLATEYAKGDLYIFPSYGEGMPTSVLEAMAFGLPVFTRNVGGLPDFFKNGMMGYITDSLNPVDFAKAMETYIENPELTRRVALYNAQYAKEHFMASKVAKQMENAIRRVLM